MLCHRVRSLLIADMELLTLETGYEVSISDGHGESDFVQTNSRILTVQAQELGMRQTVCFPAALFCVILYSQNVSLALYPPH